MNVTRVFLRLVPILIIGAAIILTSCSDDNPNGPEGSWAWAPLGEGLEGEVLSLHVHNGTLYAGGNFPSAGAESLNFIREWTGTEWAPMGEGLSYPVYDMVTYNGQLVATGTFRRSGETYVHGIATWDGSTWSTFGGGLPQNINGYYLAVNGTDLFVAGQSNYPNLERYVAVWDGSSWEVLESGAAGYHEGMCLHNGQLYVAGRYPRYNEGYVPFMVRWDGSTPHEFEPVLSGVGELCSDEGVLTAGCRGTNAVRTWSGSEWSSLTADAFSNYQSASVRALIRHEGKLVIGGNFDAVGSVRMNNIALYDDSTMSPLGGGMTGAEGDEYVQVNALAVFDGTLIAGGNFTHAGGVQVNYVAEWRYVE